jgi:hypothetical protein
MSPIKLTRDMLPNLPDEIYEMFVVPQNDAPLNIFDSQPQGRWFFHFGGLSVEEFGHLRWKRTILTFNKDIFHPDSNRDINRLVSYSRIDNVALANAILPGNPTDSRGRLAWHKKSILDTGRLCAPIVCIRTSEGIRVLDGTHRLVAATLLDNSDTIPLDAWLGE